MEAAWLGTAEERVLEKDSDNVIPFDQIEQSLWNTNYEIMIAGSIYMLRADARSDYKSKSIKERRSRTVRQFD